MESKEYQLGYKYLIGDGVEEDIDKAIYFFKIALENNDIEAAYQLGLLYEDIIVDIREAFYYYKIADDNGHPEKNGIYWLLKSNKLSNADVTYIISKVEDYFLKINKKSEFELREAIDFLDSIKRLTKEKRVFEQIVLQKNNSLKAYILLVKKNNKTFTEIEEISNYLKKHKFSENYKQFIHEIFAKKLQLMTNVNQCYELYEEIKDLDFYAKSLIMNNLNLFIANSFFHGINGVDKDIHTSLKYYAKTNSTKYEEYVFELVNELFNDEKYDEAKSMAKYLVSPSYKPFIKELEKKIYEFNVNSYFESEYKKYMNGDKTAQKLVADCYHDGNGVERNLNKAIELYEDLYIKEICLDKDVFDKLFDFYSTCQLNVQINNLLKTAYNNNQITIHEFCYKRFYYHWKNFKQSRSNHDYKECVNIIKYGICNKLDLSFPEDIFEKFEHLIFNPDAKIAFLHLECLVSINNPTYSNANSIYYLEDYYPKRNNILLINYAKENQNMIYDIKNGRNLNRVRFEHICGRIEKKLNSIITQKAYICSIPGSSQLLTNDNNMIKLIKLCKLNDNFIINNFLIQRKNICEPKHIDGRKDGLSQKEIRHWRYDYKNLQLDHHFDYRGKTIIIFDDVTTSGASMIAAKKLLYDAGAIDVYCIAIGKTV